jgi:predicted flap endonuclease-1-like 5' DNA nuclease
MVSVSVTLSDWLYQAVLSRSVLTLNRDYFGLRRPLERRIYELARKHCGQQRSWRVSVETLLKKSGSTSPRRVFRAMLREMIVRNGLPDYHLEEEPGDMIVVTRKGQVIEEGAGGLFLKPETLEAPRAGKADDLKMIKGVGPKLEALLHKLGFYHFDQIASWTEDEVSWVDQNLEGFKGRVSRDNWVEQAKLLAEGKETEFSARAKKGGVY